MKFYNQIFYFLILAFVLAIGSCKLDSKLDQEVLRIRIQDEPDCLNPILSQSGISTQIENYIMPPLFEYEGNQLELAPILIKELTPEIELNDSIIEYHYQFIDIAEWSNGNKLSAADLDFTIKAALNPYIKNKTWRNLFKNIISIQSEKPEAQSFRIQLKKDFLLSREMSGNYNLYPEYFYDPKQIMRKFSLQDLQKKDSVQFTIEEHQALKQFADEFQNEQFCKKQIQGAGAYQLKEWTSGSKIVLEKKKNWWGDKLPQSNSMQKAYPERIEYQVIPDDVSALVSIKNGSLDLSEFPPKIFSELQKENKLQFATPIVMQYNYIELNTKKIGLNEKEVRQAIAHAIDQETFIISQMQGLAQRVIGPVNPSKSFYNKELVPYSYDLEKSKTLLANAGWKDTDADGVLDKLIQGKKVKLEYKMLISGKDLGKNLALHVQEQCKKIGIAIEIVSKESAALRKDLVERNFDLSPASSGQTPGLWDPYQSWHSSNTKTPGTNRSGFATNTTDSLIQIIRTSSDVQERDLAYKKFQAILYEEQPQIFLFSPTARIAYQKNLKVNPTVKRPGYNENEIQKGLK
ncbi:MAG: ABC transporter substrate-binding protein [Saprospiraceae bacterium]|nr:hypothetical protein [Saprospiraceae bacterium]MBK7465669.1 hypothetical protein [Saprospiraceae bacterium]MBK9993908.1 hypothetical protein [Saprospiraceae bacterium]